jgi:transcriptional regulator with XRE-family HTH domain
VTPFGQKVRALRDARGVSLKQMAADLQLSPAYLSSLEHGRRGRPSEALVVQVCEYFNLIWDDFEEVKRLAALSHPRAVIDTSGMAPVHTPRLCWRNCARRKTRDGAAKAPPLTFVANV